MKNKISDQDVLNLLSNLRNAENNYPSDMIKSRRDSYIKQAAAMMALVGAGGNGDTKAGTNQATISNVTGTSLATGKLIEVALIIALVVEAVVAAYFYRDKIADFINSTLSPKVEIVASPPAGSSLDILTSEAASTQTPDGTATYPVTETPAPSVTLLPAAGNNDSRNVDTGNNDSEDVQVQSTPDPNDNPGLHLGQTKQPTDDSNNDKKDNNSQNKNKD